MQYQVVIKIENLKFGVVRIGVVYKSFGINKIFLSNQFLLSFFSFQYSFIDSAFHSSSQVPILKASIDLTSRFLVLSDINGNVKIDLKIKTTI
jgi:hypothetical protein